jgi:hypothetical protein
MPTIQERTVPDRTQSETVPRCIYCDSRMSPVITDRLAADTSYRQFCCKDCGWEVAVPLRAEA